MNGVMAWQVNIVNAHTYLQDPQAVTNLSTTRWYAKSSPT
jgi:hypothetical protein